MSKNFFTQNDKRILTYGIVSFFLYFLLVLVEKFYPNFLKEIFQPLSYILPLKPDAEIGKWLNPLTMGFKFIIISAIAGFITTPFVRIINKHIETKNQIKNLQEKDKIEKETEVFWQSIIDNLETERHTSILAKLNKLKIQDTFKLPDNPNYLTTIHLLKKLSNILYHIYDALQSQVDIINSGKNQKNKNELNDLRNNIEKINKLRADIRLLKFENLMIRSLILFISIFFPFSIAISLAWVENLVRNVNAPYPNDVIELYYAFGLIVVTYPFTSLVYSLFNIWSGKKWRQYNSLYDDFLYKSFSFLIFFFALTVFFGFGLKELYKSTEMLDFIFPLIDIHYDISEKNGIIQTIPLHNLLILKIFMSIGISYIIYLVIDFSTIKYEKYFYDESASDYILPPELIRTFGMFFVFILASALIYTSIIKYPYNLEEPAKKTKLNYSTQTPETKDSDAIVAELNDDKGLSDYIPFSIFLVTIGTLLGLSTKGLLENYFAGLALKVDSPFEERDWITVDNSEMLEVRKFGLRSIIFYGIKSNSIHNIPYNKLSEYKIQNFTQPTLDYRREVIISILDNENNKDETILKKAERLLFFAAFTTDGVKKPCIKDIENQLNLTKMNDSEKLEAIKSHLWKEPINKNHFRKTFTDKIPSLIQKIQNEESEDKEEYKNLRTEIMTNIAEIIYQQHKFNQILKKLKNNKDSNLEKKDFHILSEIAIKINLLYHLISHNRWKLKEYYTSISTKRSIDAAGITLLNIPRITSSHKISGEGILYWEIKLIVTVELAEQSDEIIHHINYKMNKYWSYANIESHTIG